jgi:hypothetical protein
MLQLGHHSYRPPWGTLGSTAVATEACLPTRAISADSGGARWTDEEEVIGLDFGVWASAATLTPPVQAMMS